MSGDRSTRRSDGETRGDALCHRPDRRDYREDLAGEPEENLPDYVLKRIDQLVPRDLWDEFGWRDE